MENQEQVKKLKTAANINAFLGSILLVPTQVATLLGTSKQPFINMTADINIVITNKLGILIKLLKKSKNEIVIFNYPFS